MSALIISLVVLLFGFVIALSYARFSSVKRQQALMEKRRQSALAMTTGFRQHLDQQLLEQEKNTASSDSSLEDEPAVSLSAQPSVATNDSASNSPLQTQRTSFGQDHAIDISDNTTAEHHFERQPTSTTGLREWDELITLTILAPPDRPFQGQQIVDALARFDLKLGDLDIYHRRTTDKASSLFSVANLISPGTLKAEQMAQFSTSGLAIFMPLPSATNSMVVFDAMLETAEGVAQHLNGRVCDKQRQPITPSTIEQLRQRILTFNFTHQQTPLF